MNKLPLIGAFLFLILFSPYGQSQSTKTDLKPIASEMNELLMKNMMKSWYPRVIDDKFGGYFSNFDYKWNMLDEQPKMIVTQSRHIWTCSKMAAFTGDKKYLVYAGHGYKFLRDIMWDKINGGFYNLVTREGVPVAERTNVGIRKNAYGNAFAIYGLSAYYKESGNADALELAKKTFYWLEEHSHDAKYGGYFQSLNIDGTPVKASSRSIPPKDQNSSIHIMEALTELYQVWPDELVRERLNEMFLLIRDVIVSRKGSLQLYMTEDLTPISYQDSSKEVHQKNFFLDHMSFGHDTETSFLLKEASEVLNLANNSKTLEISKKMVDNALVNGWDKENGGVYDAGYVYKNEDKPTILLDTKNWWAQAETLHALLIMSQLYPDDPMEYEKKFMKQWQFIKENLIDWKYGGWYPAAIDKEPDAKDALKSQIWKGNYHTARAIMNCINRINNADMAN